jgi:hypothetical protein
MLADICDLTNDFLSGSDYSAKEVLDFCWSDPHMRTDWQCGSCLLDVVLIHDTTAMHDEISHLE